VFANILVPIEISSKVANKFASLDSMAIYLKLGHKILYTPMTGEMEMP
jgi:hypothetical protein